MTKLQYKIEIQILQLVYFYYISIEISASNSFHACFRKNKSCRSPFEKTCTNKRESILDLKNKILFLHDNGLYLL